MLAMTTGCRSFEPPTTELAKLLPVASPDVAGSLHRHSLRIAIESKALSGEFEAVAATRAAPAAAGRLQLFGDLGGKLFDMAAHPESFVGYFPHAEIGVAFDASEDELPRHLIGFMAASLLEASTPITFERVRAARSLDDGGWELNLHPMMGGIEVIARLSPTGELLERLYEVRGVHWTESIGRERVFRGGDFYLTLSDEVSSVIDSIPTDAFELELPEGFHP